MNKFALFISAAAGTAFFLLFAAIAAVQYKRSARKRRLGGGKENDWLFHDLHRKAYGALFGYKDPDAVALRLGIDAEKYYRACALTRTEPDMKHLVMNHVYAFFLLFLSVILSVLVSFVSFLFGAAAFLFLVFYEQQKLHARAEGMRVQIANELPRFLDLLQSELEVGLPVETAIYILCERMDMLLTQEFQAALLDMELGVSGWVQAIEKVAVKYHVETLSDFVLDVSTSYRKGVSVANAVTRKAGEVRRTHLLNVKERAGKATNTILIPIVIFQFLPLLAFLIIPSLVQAVNGLF